MDLHIGPVSRLTQRQVATEANLQAVCVYVNMCTVKYTYKTSTIKGLKYNIMNT